MSIKLEKTCKSLMLLYFPLRNNLCSKKLITRTQQSAPVTWHFYGEETDITLWKKALRRPTVY